VASLASTKLVVAYRDQGNSNYGTARVGDVSGTTITFGSEYVFKASNASYESVAPLASDQFVVTYRDAGNYGYGTARSGTISGTTITWGTSEYVFNAANTGYTSVAVLTSTKFAVAYSDAENSNYGTAVIGDVSGSVFTFGSEYVFNNASTTSPSVAALTSTKLAVAYVDGGNSDYGTAVVGDVSGTTIAFGGESVFNAASTSLSQDRGAARLADNQFVVGYQNSLNGDGRAIVGAVTGTAISWGNQTSFNAGSSSGYITAATLLSNKFVVAWWDTNGNAKIGTLPTSPTATYADPAGSCDGNRPCYFGLQNAINAVDTGGTVTAYAGTYNESVTLSASKTVNLNGATALNGLSISAGTFTAPAGNLTLNGDFTFSGGTFIHSSGTLIFAGSGSTSTALALNNLTVNSGVTLVETQSADNVTVNGTLTNNGTVRKSKDPAAGVNTFGLAGGPVNGASLSMNVTSDGFTNMQVDYVGSQHVHYTGTSEQSGVGYARYWTLTPTGTGTVNLTLPANFTTGTNSKVCRYTGGGGSGWDCAMTSYTANTVTRNGVSSFSDWAAGNVGPTAVTLRTFGARVGQDAILPYGLAALLALIVAGGAAIRAVAQAPGPTARRPYTPPAMVYEAALEVRAGSSMSLPEGLAGWLRDPAGLGIK
jgi:hypothetical protein